MSDSNVNADAKGQDELRSALTDVIAQGLSGTWHCSRVWEAWNVGTMGQDDFSCVDESDTPAELADAVLAKIKDVTQPAEVSVFSKVARQKLTALMDRGYAVTGYALEKTVEGAQLERGFINGAGFVGWWRYGQTPQAAPAAVPVPDGGTPGPWRVRKREKDGKVLDCFVTAPDCQGRAYDAHILGDDYDTEERKLADCELIVAAVNAYRAALAATPAAAASLHTEMLSALQAVAMDAVGVGAGENTISDAARAKVDAVLVKLGVPWADRGAAEAAAHPHHCTARSADGACEECEVRAQDMAEQKAEQTGYEPPLVFLPFSARSAIARRHGMTVTADFNALVREVIAEYRARAVPSDFAAAAAVVLPEPTYTLIVRGRCQSNNPASAAFNLTDGDYNLYTEPQVRALLAQHLAIMPKGESAAAKLRAMATNYPSGHSWDKLDAKACIRGALEIEALRALLPEVSAPAAQAVAWRRSRREYHEYEGSAKEDTEGFAVIDYSSKKPPFGDGWEPLYAAPQAQADARDADGMYYLQDARWSAMVGNCPSFWRLGGGYTTSLDDAERFTLEAAMKQHKCRETDLPWLCSELDTLRRPTIDCQYMPRSWYDQRAAIAAQAAQQTQGGGNATT